MRGAAESSATIFLPGVPMKFQSRITLAAIALGALVAAGQGIVSEYNGDEITSEEGVVVMRVIWDRSSSGGVNKTTNRDADKLTGVFKEAAGGKRKVLVDDIYKIRAFVMPAGRWYLAEIRTPSERNLPQIAKELQSFEVLGDHINFTGIYTIQMMTSADGKQMASVSVDFVDEGKALVKEASDAWPALFAKKTLVYCPVGRKCKLPEEFKF